MKYKIFIFNLFVLISGCSASIDFDLPASEEPVVELSPNSNLMAVTNQYIQSGEEIYTFPEDSDMIVEAIVASSDEAGNFYKSLILQDPGVKDIRGLSLMIDLRAYFTRYEMGRVLYLRIAGLSMHGDNGAYSLGYMKQGELSAIPESLLNRFIVRSQNRLEIDVPLVSTSELGEDRLNTRIKMDRVQFEKEDLGKTYAGEPYDSYNALRPLRKCDDEAPISLSTSIYADFKSQLLPKSAFVAEGILSREYGGQLVLVVNSPEDLVITEESRCPREFLACEAFEEGEEGGNGVAGSSQILFYEDFEQIRSTSAIMEAGWLNMNRHFGIGKFVKRTSNDNAFVRISSYGTGEAVVDAMLISPPIELDGSRDEELTFQTRATFNNGRLLTVWITTDLDSDPREAQWRQLEARISEGSADGTNEKFMSSGPISLNCVQGKARIAFRYLGGDPGPSTNYDLDNVLVKGKIH